MLKDIKNGQNRADILRLGINCSDIFYVISGDDQVEPKLLLHKKFKDNSLECIKRYGGWHERDSKVEFLAHMKVG